MAPSDSLQALLQIFECDSKAALKAHVDQITIQSDDFANLILAAKVGAIPIGHVAVHKHYQPDHLDLTDDNLRALSENGVGPLNKGARKTMNKVMATFAERRLFNAHFFFLTARPGEWQLFYFDQRDVAGEHWIGGPHLHLMNRLTHPTTNPIDLMEQLADGHKPPSLSGLHIRYHRA